MAIPSKINGSFVINSPSTSYTVAAVPVTTASFRNPEAPLLEPCTKVGTERLTASPDARQNLSSQ